ncbi:Vacuolar membrane protein [Pleurostoma richardsiae]|uniref:Vacuolar membrane protein n=1 Tax=Pleurostoma richardsiae TaxID=41990 RepID=A0AA38RCL3_9PEZI|nr:Vacuolar membrane protein [Pleurostoma richardsiae]
MARWTLGIILLLVTVSLWTASNFMFSYMFSDNTYSKPFFVVYVDTSMFAISLIPVMIRYFYQHGMAGVRLSLRGGGHQRRGNSAAVMAAAFKTQEAEDEDASAGQRLLVDEEAVSRSSSAVEQELELDEAREAGSQRLGLRETAWLSLEFCMLWFLANYFASACMEHTSVGSATILTSTSSVWTLIFASLMRVEGFTVRKLAGVLASLAGVVLISTVDLSGESDEHRGSFPHKSRGQIAVGDAMALFSAMVYGLYVTVMKRRVGSEDRVDMSLFFGLVGLFNVLLLWPGFFILHFTGIETFQMPPTGKIWAIIMINSVASFVSDVSWAYAMLLTTPLVVTVGLSLTIPLSLIGEMIQYAQYSTWVYWVGAGVVFLSFVFINHESHDEEHSQPENTHS